LDMYETSSRTDRLFGPTLIRPSASIPPAANNAARLPPPDTESPTNTSRLEADVGVRHSGACEISGSVIFGTVRHPDIIKAPAISAAGATRQPDFISRLLLGVIPPTESASRARTSTQRGFWFQSACNVRSLRPAEPSRSFPHIHVSFLPRPLR